MKRIAVLLSNKGTGSNLGAIFKAIDKKIIKNGKIVIVVSNKEDAYGLVRAKKRGISTMVFDLKDYYRRGKSREEYDESLGKLLKNEYQVDLVVLAGWMLILSKKFINFFKNKIINLHPGLLADSGSKYITLSTGEKIKAIRGMHTNDAVQFALDQNYPITGSSVHFITSKVDEGPVILRSVVKIKRKDTVETLYRRMKSEEHKILPQAIALYCDGKLIVSDGKVSIN